MISQQQVERSGNSNLSVDALIVDLGKQEKKTTDMTLGGTAAASAAAAAI